MGEFLQMVARGGNYFGVDVLCKDQY